MKIKSLTTRISLIVTFLTILVLIVTIATVYVSSRNKLQLQAEQETQHHLDLMVQSLSTVQTAVEAAAINSITALNGNMRDTTAVMNILLEIVKNNKYVNSVAVAYAPDYLPNQPYCLPIASRYGVINGHFEKKENTGEYIYNEWYMVPVEKKQPFWTDPYSNELNIPVVSYAVPIQSDSTACKGVLTLSIELSSFVNLLYFNRNDSTFEQSFQKKDQRNHYILFDRSTSFLTTPHTDYIMNETLFTLAESHNDSLYSHIGNEIVNGRNGQAIIEVDDEQSVATWRILPKLQWTALVLTPYSEVIAPLKQLTTTTLLVAFLAVGLSVIVLIYSVRKSLTPMKKLQSATRLLGEGQYDTELPEYLTKRADEIGELGREFVKMKKAVVSNMEQLENERQYVKDNNRMLTMLVQNVVTNLQMPLSNVLSFTDGLAVLAGDSEEAKVFRQQAEEGGKDVMQQFRQLNEMAHMMSSAEHDNQSSLMVVPSNEFMKSVIESVPQLEKKYYLTMTKLFHSTKPLPIKTDPSRLEALIYQLVFECSRTSNNPEVALYSILTTQEDALLIMIECETAQPIPENERENFFTQFAKQKINNYAKDDLLQLYICHYSAEQMGASLYIDPAFTRGNRFVLKYPKYVEEES